MLSTHCPHVVPSRTARNTEARLFPDVAQIFYRSMADSRRAESVHSRFNDLVGDRGLSFEGFRQQFIKGRFSLSDLPRLCEAMALEQVDPTISLAALESACLPRDPELNGNLADELEQIACELGQLATTIRHHGHDITRFDTSALLNIVQIAGRTMSAARRLNQEALDATSTS